MMVAATPVTTPPPMPLRVLHAIQRLPFSGRVGLVIVSLVAGIALFGPLLGPHAPSEIMAEPYAPAGNGLALGTDFIGRDLLSRVLSGGQTVVGLSAIATFLAYVIGANIGMAAAYIGGWTDALLMRSVDILLAFPPFLFLLVLASGTKPGPISIVIGVAVIQVPSVARVIRAAAQEVSVRAYVEAAVARAESTWFVLSREIFPNIVSTVVADGGPRYTGSILLIASLTFLGLGLQPPAADWALMISENRDGLTFAPLGVLVPAGLIMLLTIGVNLLGDGVARSLGRSAPTALVRR
jgi:ABC-type dipeptide/oligopeptide/nickel transport system permease subunit